MLGFKFPCLLLELPWPLYKSPVVCRRPRTFPRPWKPQLSTDDIVPSLAPGNPSCLYRRPRTFPGPCKSQLSTDDLVPSLAPGNPSCLQTTSYLPWPLETPVVYTDDLVPSRAPGNPSCLYRRPRTFPGPWKPQLSTDDLGFRLSPAVPADIVPQAASPAIHGDVTTAETLLGREKSADLHWSYRILKAEENNEANTSAKSGKCDRSSLNKRRSEVGC